MERRSFIRSLLGAGAVAALDYAIPFNRVWFFPKTIKLYSPSDVLDLDRIAATTLQDLRDDVMYDNFFVGASPLFKKLRGSSTPEPWVSPFDICGIPMDYGDECAS